MFLVVSGPLDVVNASCPGEPDTVCGNGDVNADGSVNLADAVYILQHLFAGGPAIEAMECEPEIVNDPDGCPMAGRFVENDGNGTVTDTCTRLMWQQDTAPIGRVTYSSARQYCENLDLGEHSDWRLPTVRELHSLVHYGRHDPAIDPVFRGYDPGYPWYWSSTTMAGLSDAAWGVGFARGRIDGKSGNKSLHPGYVRAVRTVQAGP
jgi:hypothetical protein